MAGDWNDTPTTADAITVQHLIDMDAAVRRLPPGTPHEHFTYYGLLKAAKDLGLPVSCLGCGATIEPK